MGVSIPWALHWTPDTLSGSHPTLPSWTVHQWAGDPEDILRSVMNTFLLQMLDDRPIELDKASTYHLEGWSVYVPIPSYQYQRCELWDALWKVRILDGVKEDVLCALIGVTDVHDLVSRLSPIRRVESWNTWHQEVYQVLHDLSDDK